MTSAGQSRMGTKSRTSRRDFMKASSSPKRRWIALMTSYADYTGLAPRFGSAVSGPRADVENALGRHSERLVVADPRHSDSIMSDNVSQVRCRLLQLRYPHRTKCTVIDNQMNPHQSAAQLMAPIAALASVRRLGACRPPACRAQHHLTPAYPVDAGAQHGRSTVHLRYGVDVGGKLRPIGSE